MKYINLAIIAPLLLIGCSDDNDGTNPSVTLPVMTPVNDPGVSLPPDTNIPSELYTDSTISLLYPSSWLVNPNGAIFGIDAQFTAPQTNSLGGFDNCSFEYAFDSSLSLMDALDQLLERFDTTPEPRQEFLEVNGVPAAKVIGNLTTANVTFPATLQIMVQDDQFVFATCAAVNTDEETIELILDSVTFI